MVLLITGTTGIAEATGRLASERGHAIFLAGLPDFDLTTQGAAERALEQCVALHGRVDGVFNVAGASGRSQGDGPLHECSGEGWRYTMETNLTTTFHTCRAVLRYWLEHKQPGAVLNMSSISALSPEPRYFAAHAYAAAKGAILSLTRAIAAYYAPYGIRANCIAPGLVRTPMSRRAQADPAILEFIRGKQPLSGGILEPEDVARAALFLLSEDARHITGEVLGVDGGWAVSGG